MFIPHFQAIISDKTLASAQTITSPRNEGQTRGKTKRENAAEVEKESSSRRRKRETQAGKRKEKGLFYIFI